MSHRIALFTLLVLSGMAGSASAQDDPRFIPGHSSAKGNYITFADATALKKDPQLFSHTAYFIIRRSFPLDSSGVVKDTAMKVVGKARPVSTVRELGKYFNPDEIQELDSAFGLASPASLVQYFQARRSPDDYSIYYSQLRIQLALGHTFLDEAVQPGQLFYYMVTRVDTNGQSEPWSTTFISSKQGSYSLPYYKARHVAFKILDSLVYFTWRMPAGNRFRESIPRPHSSWLADSSAVALGLAEDGQSLTASVRVIENGRTREISQLIPQLNAAGDSVTYNFSVAAKTDEELNVFLVPQDIFGNEGIPSDTISTYAVSERNAPLIYGIHVEDDTDAIRIHWKQLPDKPYLTGILITRQDSNNDIDTVAVLPAADSSFTDFKITPGNQYSYGVRALFDPSTGIVQKIPADGVGSYTRFSVPETPKNLRARAEGRNIRLSWDSVSSRGLYGYYIYRGMSPLSRDLVAGPVMAPGYLDTAGFLSGRTDYYYWVVAQNYRQDTSELSEYTSIRPARAVVTSSPGLMEFYYANGKLDVSWNDIREMDNGVRGYVLQKRVKDSAGFITVAAGLSEPSFEDGRIAKGTTYQYRVAAISLTGDTAEFSEAHEYTLQAPGVAVMEKIFLQNTSEGIVVSWPAVRFEGRKAYNIWRRRAGEESLQKIGSANADAFRFVDKNVTGDEQYVYSVSIVMSNGEEGAQGVAKSIRRAKNVKAPTTL